MAEENDIDFTSFDAKPTKTNNELDLSSFDDPGQKKKATTSAKPGSGISSGAENYFGNNPLSGANSSGGKSFDITQKPTTDKASFTPNPVDAITNYVQKKREQLPFKPRAARTELSADQQEANKQVAVKSQSGIPSVGEEISTAVFGKGDNSAQRIQQAAEEQSAGQTPLSPDKAVDLGKRINENIGMNRLADYVQKQATPDAENIAIDIRKKNEEWNRLPIEQREEMRAWAKDQATAESQKTIEADEKRLSTLMAERKKVADRDGLLNFSSSDSGTNAAEFKKIDDEIQTLNTRIAYNKMRPDNMTARIFQNDDDVIDDLKEPAAQFLNTVKENDPTAYSRLASSLYDGSMTDAQKGEIIRGALDIKNQEIGSRIQFTKESGVFDKIKTYNTALVDYNQKKKDIDGLLAASKNNPDQSQTGQLNILKAEADRLKQKLDTYQEAGIQTDIDDLSKLDYSIDRQQELVTSSSLKYKLFEDQEKSEAATKFVEDHPVVGRMWEVLKKAAGLPGQFVKSGAEIGSQIYDKGGKLLGYDTETGAYDKLSGRFSPVEMFDALIPTQADLKVIDKDGSINYSNVINGTANTLGDMAVLLAGGAKFGAAAEAVGVSSKVSGSVGLLLSSYAQTRPDYFKTALDAGMKPVDAGKFADASAILTSALELISPNEALFGKEAKNEFTREFAKYFTKDGWKYAFEKSSERLFKEIIPENIQELSQSLGDKAVEYAANKIYNKDIFDANLSAAEVKETVLMTTLATGILTGIRNPSLNREEKQSYVLEAARNNNLFQASIAELNLSPEDKAAVSGQVEKYSKALSSIPSSVSVPTQNAIAPLLVAKQSLAEDLTKDNIDEAFKTRAKEKIKNIDEKIIGLTDGKYNPAQLNITDDPAEAAQPLPEPETPAPSAPVQTAPVEAAPVITPTIDSETETPPVVQPTGGTGVSSLDTQLPNAESTTPSEITTGIATEEKSATQEVGKPTFVREVEVDHPELGKINLGENNDGSFEVTYPDGSSENLSRENVRSEFGFNPDADTTSPETYDLAQATDANYVAKLYDDKVKELEDTGSIDGAIAQYRPSFTQEEYARINGQGIPTTVRQQYTNIAAKNKERGVLPIDTQVQEINNIYFDGQPIVSEQDIIDFALKYPTGVDSFTTKAGNPELAAINEKYKELTGKNLRKDHAAKLAAKYNASIEEAGAAIEASEKADVSIDRMLDQDLQTSQDFLSSENIVNEWRKQLNQYIADPSTPFNIWNDAFEGRVLTPEEITNINQLIDERATKQTGRETGNEGPDSGSNIAEPESTEPGTTEPGKPVADSSAGEPAPDNRTAAQRVRDLKSKPGSLNSFGLGLGRAVWDGALETIATSLEIGESIADAVRKAVDYIKSNSRLRNEATISSEVNDMLTEAGVITAANQTDLNVAEQNVRGTLANYQNLNAETLPVVERNMLKAYSNLAVAEIQGGMKTITQFAAKTGKTTAEVQDAWDMAKDAIKNNPLDPAAEIELNLPIPPAFDQMGKPVKMSIETFAEFYQRTRAWDAMNNNVNITGTPVPAPTPAEPRPTQNPGETLASWANRLNQWRMNQMPNYIASLNTVDANNNAAGPASAFAVAPESKFEYLSRKNIDFMNRLKKVIDAIIAAGGNITPQNNPYTNFFFLGSKANKKNLDMLERVVHTNEKGKKALFQQMKDDKISVNDLGMYMYAEFAPERNKNIAERRREDLAIEIDRVEAIKAQKEQDGKITNAEVKQLAALRSGKAPGFELMEDGGSGMFNDVAELIIEQFNDNGQGQLLAKYAEQFRDLVTRPELKMKLDNGLISVEEYDNILNNGAKYIPLKVEEYYKQHRIPTVTNVKGTNKDLKRAVGSILQDYTKRVNPALAALEQYEATVVNSDKNAWITNLRDVVNDNPNYDLWEVVNPQYMPKYKADGTFVSLTEITPEQMKQESVKGFSDGKPYYVHLKDPILRRTLRGDFKTKDPHALMALRGLNKVNNYFRKIQTLKNPEFIFGNVFKDIQEADFILTAQEVKGLKQSFRKGLIPAGKAIINYQRGIRNTPETIKYENYLNSGAKITFNDFIDSQERLNNIQKDLEKHGFKGSTALQVWRKVGDFLESASDVAEVTSRFSVYNAMLEKGFSEQEAAKMSRDATIDFAKKGEITHITNSLFLFMNAAAQGGYNLTKALITSPKARALYAKSAGVGLLLAAYNSAMSDDDDDDNNYWKISEYERQNNWIFKIPGQKGFLKVPMGRALSSPIYLGSQTLGMISGKLDKSEAATAVMFSFANLINPLGNTEDLVQAATPTAVRPIIQWYSNRNAFGSKIYKEGGFAENNPDSQNFFKNNSKESKAIAEWLNNNTGGSDVEKGFIDVSPGTLDFGASTAFGGRGKFYKNLYDNISQIWDQNEDTKSPKLPLVGRFYTTGAPSSYESKVWAALQESNTNKFDEKDADNFRKNLTKSLEKNEINYKEFKSLNREFQRNQLEIDIQKANPDLTKEERKALMKRIK